MKTDRFFNSVGDVSRQLRYSGKVALYPLMEPINFYSDIADTTIVVPIGFVSDLATIPQFLQFVFMKSDDPRIAMGAWVHDYIYYLKGNIEYMDHNVQLTKSQCDKILAYEAMVTLGATKLQSHLVYYALMLFGDKLPK